MEVIAGEIEENNLWKKTPDQDFNFQESLIGSSDVPKHVLIVMDALKEFSIEPLEWALKNVEPKIRTEMGHPLKLLVVDLITSLQATLVVFDRHHDKKNIEYYAEKVPYDMIVINEDGEMDMIKGRSQKIKKAEESPASMVPSATKPMISGQIIKFFKPKCVKT
ncbi:hypothetical protein RND71_015990 [Anisodus tanguticus]|uniref:Uncharacterized protein n=1 Tax=Anisodus tanguticus TaxID=243964 RepID=A0AAE1S7M5_9SOLA|nr:hypothetical protein RND71_015990 [Anisodus tanguticus]